MERKGIKLNILRSPETFNKIRRFAALQPLMVTKCGQKRLRNYAPVKPKSASRRSG